MYKLNLFICVLLLLLTNVTEAIGDAPVPAALFTSARNADVVNADAGALYYSSWLLSPGFAPPPKSHFTLIPHTAGNECDIARMTYQVGDKSITISQVRFMMLCEIGVPQKDEKLLQVGEVKSLAEQFFQHTDIQNYFLVYNAKTDSLQPIIDQKGTGANWWQTLGNIGFYHVKDDGRVSSLMPTLTLAANAYWFTRNQKKSDGKQETYDPQRILAQMKSPPSEPVILRLREYASIWDEKFINSDYRLPQALRYSTVPASRINGLQCIQVKYESKNKLITINHSSTLSSIQIEEQGTDAKPPLSDEDTEKLLMEIFRNSGGVKILTTNATATMAEGFAKVAADSRSPWLNRLHWWQDSGRVIFYLPQDASK